MFAVSKAKIADETGELGGEVKTKEEKGFKNKSFSTK